MRAILTAILLTVETQAEAKVVNLCDEIWWIGATETGLPAELAARTDVMEK